MPETLLETINLVKSFSIRKGFLGRRQTLVAVEQTANAGGGRVWPLEHLNAVAEVAHENGMVTHMDGARLMNAVVASGVPAHEMCAGYDTVWLTRLPRSTRA